jgi:hypothetical protein
LARQFAVHAHVNAGVIQRLLDPEVPERRHFAQFDSQLFRVSAESGKVRARYRQLDRSGRAKIHNLADDVSGLEREGAPRKLRRQNSA